MAEKLVNEKKTAKMTSGGGIASNGKEYLKKGSENNYGLSKDKIVQAYRAMLLTRFTDDRIDTLIKQGKAAFLISGSGHEAIQVAIAMAMQAKKDWFFTYYRDNGIATALGITPEMLFQHLIDFF